MALLEQDHAFEIADALIEASDADETEVSLHCVEERFVRYAPDGPTQAADRERYELRIRVRFRAGDGYREASASAGSLDEESVFGALDRATILARLAAPDPAAQPLGGPVAIEPTAPSRPTQDHTVREKGEWIRAALDASLQAGFHASGLARSGVECRGLANSAGRRAFGASSVASFSLSCADPGADAESSGAAASGERTAPFVDQVDVASLIDEVVDAALASRAPVAIGAGPKDVVLAPAAVAALLAHAASAGFGAREVAEGSSFMAGRTGEHLFDPRITIHDDVAHPALRGFRFDGEGSRRTRAALVEAGRLGTPVTDERWARRLGLANTGHGRVQPTSDGPLADALVMDAGEASFGDLVGAVGDGLYVRGLHYVNVVDPAGLVLTGMTRGGTYRIENGRVTHAVQNLRFTDSLVRALAAVIGVGADARRVSSFGGDLVVPSLALRGFHFTSA